MQEVSICLQDEALVLLATALLRKERGAGGVLEYLTDTLVSLCRTLEVLVGADLLADLLSLLFVLAADFFVDARFASCVAFSWSRTCSGVTGFWEVLWSSSMVFWS